MDIKYNKIIETLNLDNLKDDDILTREEIIERLETIFKNSKYDKDIREIIRTLKELGMTI